MTEAEFDTLIALSNRLARQYATIPAHRRDGKAARMLELCSYHAALLIGGLEDLQKFGKVTAFKPGASHDALS